MSGNLTFAGNVLTCCRKLLSSYTAYICICPIIYLLSSLYVCMAIKHIIVLFVETPPCFVFICSNKFTWCFHKQNYYNLPIVYKSVLQVEIVRVLLCRKWSLSQCAAPYVHSLKSTYPGSFIFDLHSYRKLYFGILLPRREIYFLGLSCSLHVQKVSPRIHIEKMHNKLFTCL
jgi:hypothetical protein